MSSGSVEITLIKMKHHLTKTEHFLLQKGRVIVRGGPKMQHTQGLPEKSRCHWGPSKAAEGQLVWGAMLLGRVEGLILDCHCIWNTVSYGDKSPRTEPHSSVTEPCSSHFKHTGLEKTTKGKWKTEVKIKILICLLVTFSIASRTFWLRSQKLWLLKSVNWS